jgi:outer membrane protein assembly factor BamB
MPRRFLLAVLLTFSSSVFGDDWPQWGGPKRDCLWRETGIVETLPKGLLPRVWSTPVGEGYSGPAVAGDKVFITDLIERQGREGQERVRCLNAETGKEVWSHKYPVRYDIDYPAGPRATPTVDGEHVYAVGAIGNLFCFKATDGTIVWKKDFQEDYHTRLPMWGIAAPPLVDRDQVICLVGGANGATMVSFDKLTGKEKWRALNDPEVGYAPPVIFEFGKTRQLIAWHPQAVSALDPATGKVLWEVPFRIKAGLTVPMPKQVGNRIFVTSFYNGPMMLDVTGSPPAAKVEWKGSSNSEVRTDGLHSIMPTPIVTETNIYGICSYGQLRCLDAKTGKRIWETREATGDGRWWNAFLIPNGDRVFIHNEQGDLILANLSPEGYKEIARAKLVEPTRRVNERMTILSHPAFAHKSVFARNDKEIVRVNLSKP